MAIKDATTVAGSTLGISATLPATEDAAGYAALTFTNIGKIVDMGSGLGRVYNVVTNNPIDTRRTSKAKGSYDVQDLSLVVNIKEDDAGQVILDAALASDNDYAFELDTNDNPGGSTNTIVYFSGMVTSKPRNMGTIDNITTWQVNIAVNTDEIKVAAT